MDSGSAGCFCRRALGSFSSRYNSAARWCSSSFAATRWARVVHRAPVGLTRSTAATSAPLPTCPWRIARSSCICECAAFAAVNKKCPRGTFVEQVSLVQRYARRTRRLRGDLEEIGLALGGRPGGRLSTLHNKPTSRVTLLRLVRALPDPPIEAPRVLGVDEFAFRRGRRYGTSWSTQVLTTSSTYWKIPPHDALVGWLGEHPGAEVICRDRDGVYASAAGAVLQMPCKWPIGGTSSTIWLTHLSE